MTLAAVLLPGLDGSGKQFALLAERLEKVMPTRIVSYPTDSASYEDHLRQVLAALPTQVPYLLIAESYSGPVAIQVAARQPIGLRGLVLCASFARCPSWLLRHLRFLLEVMPSWRMPTGLLSPFVLGKHKTASLLALLEAGLASASPQVLLERLKSVARVDVSTEAGSITVPTLYLRATSDRLVPASAGAAIVKCIPGAILRDIDGPHFLLQASADAASKEILSFASARVG